MAEKIYEGTRPKGAGWSYRIKMTLPNGTKINKEKCGFKSSYEAYQARIEEIGRIKLTNFVEKRITLNQLYDLYLEESATKQKSYNTIKRYNSIYNNHFRNTFGDILVGRIQPLQITHFLNEKAKVYKSEYPNDMYDLFLLIFEFARKHKYINEDIMDCVERPPKYIRPEVQLPTPEQFNALEQRLQTTNVQVAFTIGKNTGLRCSEVYALRWSDFDFEKNCLKVNKQFQKVERVWTFVDPKNEQSKRTVYFGEEFSQYMQFVKKIQEENRKRYGAYYKSNTVRNSVGILDAREGKMIVVDDLVCVKEKGDMLSPDSNKVVSRIATEMGIDFHFHLLRHYYISALHQNGVDITVIRDNVGHNGLKTIMKVYSHTSEEQRTRAGAVIDRLMGAKNLMPETVAE